MNVGVGVRVQGGGFLSLPIPRPFGEGGWKLGFAESLWLRSSGPARQDPQEFFGFFWFFAYTSHWLKVLGTVL